MDCLTPGFPGETLESYSNVLRLCIPDQIIRSGELPRFKPVVGLKDSAKAACN